MLHSSLRVSTFPNRIFVQSLLLTLLALHVSPVSLLAFDDAPLKTDGSIKAKISDRNDDLEHVDQALPVRVLPRDNQLVYLDLEGQIQPVLTLAELQSRRNHTLSMMNSILGRNPGAEKQVSLDWQVIEELDQGSYLEQKITYKSEPNGVVPAYLLIPKTALQEGAKRHPAVLCLHPTNLKGPLSITRTDPVRDMSYAKDLAERGYVVLAPSYPILGDYQPDIVSLGWQSGMLKATWDNRRGLDLLDSLQFVEPAKYGAIGHSLGGHNAIFTAFYDERIQVVVSSCGLDSFVDYYSANPEMWRAGKGWTQLRYLPQLAHYAGRLEEIPFDFYEIIAGLAPRHVLISAPTGDDNFRVESVQRIFQAVLPVYELHSASDRLQVVHPDTGHEFPTEIRELAYQRLDQVLKEKNE